MEAEGTTQLTISNNSFSQMYSGYAFELKSAGLITLLNLEFSNLTIVEYVLETEKVTRLEATNLTF